MQEHPFLLFSDEAPQANSSLLILDSPQATSYFLLQLRITHCNDIFAIEIAYNMTAILEDWSLKSRNN